MKQIDKSGYNFEDDEIHKFMILLADGKPVRGRLKLQKMIFVLAESIEDLNLEASYAPDYFGPYSETVDYEYDYLKSIGILHEHHNEIFLTDIGKGIMEILRGKTDDKLLHMVKECKEFFNDLTEHELLAYIYSAYPDMAGESTEYEKIQSENEDLILSLIKKGKISSGRGAELLHTTMSHIIKKMNEKGMQVLR